MIPSGATSPLALPLHRAFSVFLFGGREHGHRMLIQQRPLHKATFPGLWANACCSHPLVSEGDDMVGAMRRRLREELGLEVGAPDHGDVRGSATGPGSPRFAPLGRLLYAARCPVNANWGEHELDHLYALEMDSVQLAPREEEVAAVRWVDPTELMAEIRERPADFVPWFKAALRDLILPVWVDLHHRRRGGEGSRWPSTEHAKIIRYDEPIC